MQEQQQQQHHDGGYEKIKYITLLAASFVGGAAAVVTTTYHRKKEAKTALTAPNEIFPRLDRTGSGRVGNIERFSHYVARQLGFSDANECPKMCKLAYEYLQNSKGCKDSIYEYLASEADADSLYIKFTEELDRCILGYFAFHWSQTSHMISQVFEVESEKRTKLKDYVLAATRKQRFERISKDLKVTRVFSTLLEEMKVIGNTSLKGESSKCTEVMKPMAHSERSPVLLLMGGGMGAGKSTVLKDILKDSFWAGAEKNAVVVEADAFKETDVLYRALSLKGHHHDMLQSAELVHQSSTNAASSLLVTALNEGRDVIMDGTLSWAPFVEQTIAMARNIHNCRYRMGVGYKEADDGTVTENYWEQVHEEEEDEHQKLERAQKPKRKPYRIELVGVVCDAYLAVIRGIRRAIMIRRAVRVNSQIQSHQRFASAFTGYCQLVDNARLYCTNAMAGPPKLIGWKNGDNNLLVDPEEIKCLRNLSNLNSKADSIYELYTHNSGLILEPGSVWKEAVLSPARPAIQLKLKTCIQIIEISSSTTADKLS